MSDNLTWEELNRLCQRQQEGIDRRAAQSQTTNYLPRVLRQWADNPGSRFSDAMTFDLRAAADEMERLRIDLAATAMTEWTVERAFIDACRREFSQLIELSQDTCIYEGGKRVSFAHAFRSRAAAVISACNQILKDSGP